VDAINSSITSQSMPLGGGVSLSVITSILQHSLDATAGALALGLEIKRIDCDVNVLRLWERYQPGFKPAGGSLQNLRDQKADLFVGLLPIGGFDETVFKDLGAGIISYTREHLDTQGVRKNHVFLLSRGQAPLP